MAYIDILKEAAIIYYVHLQLFYPNFFWRKLYRCDL